MNYNEEKNGNSKTWYKNEENKQYHMVALILRKCLKINI